jgi:hypothetical protein
MQFSQACPGQGVLRLHSHRLEQTVARLRNLEIGLLRIGQRDPRRRPVRAQGDSLPGVRHGLGLVVLHHPDDGPERQRGTHPGVEGERLPYIAARLLHAARGEVLRGLVKVALRAARRGAGKAGRRYGWGVVERPLGRVARPYQGEGKRRLAGVGGDRPAGAHRDLALRVRRDHGAFEHGKRAAPVLRAEHEFRSLDGAVQVGGVDEHAPGFAAERLQRAAQQIQD